MGAKKRDVLSALLEIQDRTKELKKEKEKLKKEALMELGKTLLEMRLEGREMVLPEELEAKLEMVKKVFGKRQKKAPKDTQKNEPITPTETPKERTFLNV